MKKRLSIKQLERERKNYMISFYIIALCCFILLYIIISSNFSTNYNKTVKINYDNLNYTERDIVNNIIIQLRPEYYHTAKSITFSKNKSIIAGWYFRKKSNIIVGRNVNGHIFVFYSDSILNMKTTLCHEIFHNLINSGNEDEWFVNDIESHYEICFEENK